MKPILFSETQISSLVFALASNNSIEEVRGGTLDYLGRFSRFSFHSHAARALQSHAGDVTPQREKQIKLCVYHVGRVLDWALDLSLYKRERVRYIAKSSGIIVSCCCLFNLASCQTFGSRVKGLYENLDKAINHEADARHGARRGA